MTDFFAIISRKYKKWIIFDIFMTITLEVNMVTKQMTTLFIELYPLVYFISAIQNLQNLIP